MMGHNETKPFWVNEQYHSQTDITAHLAAATDQASGFYSPGSGAFPEKL
jgi:hypothetical protein